jgi:hypothetical protein
MLMLNFRGNAPILAALSVASSCLAGVVTVTVAPGPGAPAVAALSIFLGGRRRRA